MWGDKVAPGPFSFTLCSLVTPPSSRSHFYILQHVQHGLPSLNFSLIFKLKLWEFWANGGEWSAVPLQYLANKITLMSPQWWFIQTEGDWRLWNLQYAIVWSGVKLETKWSASLYRQLHIPLQQFAQPALRTVCRCVLNIGQVLNKWLIHLLFFQLNWKFKLN